MVVNGLNGPVAGAFAMFGSSRPGRATREELAGVCCGGRTGGHGHCINGEPGSNLCNSVQRLHVPCPSDPIFVRKSAIDKAVHKSSSGYCKWSEGRQPSAPERRMVRF